MKATSAGGEDVWGMLQQGGEFSASVNTCHYHVRVYRAATSNEKREVYARWDPHR